MTTNQEQFALYISLEELFISVLFFSSVDHLEFDHCGSVVSEVCFTTKILLTSKLHILRESTILTPLQGKTYAWKPLSL